MSYVVSRVQSDQQSETNKRPQILTEETGERVWLSGTMDPVSDCCRWFIWISSATTEQPETDLWSQLFILNPLRSHLRPTKRSMWTASRTASDSPEQVKLGPAELLMCLFPPFLKLLIKYILLLHTFHPTVKLWNNVAMATHPYPRQRSEKRLKPPVVWFLTGF